MKKLPKNAKQVFQGVMFDTYQWDQKMYDGSTKVFEVVQRQDTVEAIMTVNGKILIQEQQQPHKPETFLSLPGGRVDPGEDHKTAIAREVLEETGHEADEWQLLHSVQPFTSIRWKMSVFIGRDARRVAEQTLDAGEKITNRFVTFEEFLDLIDSGSLARIEQDLRALVVRAKYSEPHRKELHSQIFC